MWDKTYFVVFLKLLNYFFLYGLRAIIYCSFGHVFAPFSTETWILPRGYLFAVSSAPVSILPSNAMTSLDNLHEPFDISKGFTKMDSIQPVESQAMVGLGSSGFSANKGVLIYKQNANDTPVNTVAKEGKTGSKVSMTELRNFLITLLEENPNGMTIKVTYCTTLFFELGYILLCEDWSLCFYL